jgi:hypothetical protein
MCNLCSQTRSQAEIRDLARAMGKAPVVRALPSGERELLMMRCSFPQRNIPGQKPRNPYLTNLRNTGSRYWQTTYLKSLSIAAGARC